MGKILKIIILTPFQYKLQKLRQLEKRPVNKYLPFNEDIL